MRELCHVRTAHQIVQFRLADQDQLQKLVLVGVDIGEHPKFLQRFPAEVLRLVENQDHPATVSIFLDQMTLKAGKQIHIGLIGPRRQIQRHQHPAQKLAARALGIRDEADRHILFDASQQMMHQSGFARPHFTGDQGDRRMGQQPVFQHRIGAAVLRRPVDEGRIRQQRERPLGQAEEAAIDIEGGAHAPPGLLPDLCGIGRIFRSGCAGPICSGPICSSTAALERISVLIACHSMPSCGKLLLQRMVQAIVPQGNAGGNPAPR